jgi:hypothetical protein
VRTPAIFTLRGWLRFLRQWDETDLDPLVECGGDAAEHGERVSCVISVFKPADDRRSCPDQLGELLLGQAGRLAEVVDLPGDLGVGALLFELL